MAEWQKIQEAGRFIEIAMKELESADESARHGARISLLIALTYLGQEPFCITNGT